jgi:hypothetical protein
MTNGSAPAYAVPSRRVATRSMTSGSAGRHPASAIWQLRGGQDEDRERQAVRLIGVTFFALAAYLAVEAVRDLAGHARPASPAAGLAIAAAALAVMPALALAKRRTGQA